MYRIESAGTVVAPPVEPRLSDSARSITVPADESSTTAVMITVPATAFHAGQCDVRLRVSDGQAFSQEFSWRLLGPQEARQRTTP